MLFDKKTTIQDNADEQNKDNKVEHSTPKEKKEYERFQRETLGRIIKRGAMFIPFNS